MENLKKAQSILEYICVCIVFAGVGIGTLFIMANHAAGLQVGKRHTDSITSPENYTGEAPLPNVDPNNPPPPTTTDEGVADESNLPVEWD